MNWLKKLISRWVSEGRMLRRLSAEASQAVPAPILGHNDTSHDVVPKMRLAFIEAINGRIIEVTTAIQHTHHQGHYEWKTELFIVREDQNLNEAISMLMLLKGA